MHTTHPHTQVVVLEKGVVEQGTHDELISQGGVCKQLVLRQLLAGNYSTSVVMAIIMHKME